MSTAAAASRMLIASATRGKETEVGPVMRRAATGLEQRGRQ